MNRTGQALALGAPAWRLLLAICLVAAGGPARAQAGAIDEGRRLFVACAACHGERGQGDAKLGAPNIGALDAAYVERQLRQFAQGWRGADPKNPEAARMRAAAQALTDTGQMNLIAGFVAALPLTPASRSGARAPDSNLANGRNYFNAICSACHNSNAMGGASLGAPRLAGTDPPYLLRQLSAFRSGARGAHPADTYGAQMRKMVQILPDAAADRDVVAYLASLPTNGAKSAGAKP